jgi:hypothetical protein
MRSGDDDPLSTQSRGNCWTRVNLLGDVIAGVKASREASQTHRTVNQGESDHDQRKEGGWRIGADDTGFPSPSDLHVQPTVVFKTAG